MSHEQPIDANRKLWDVRTALHLDSDFYDVDGFLAGKSSLCGIESDELGDIAGKSVLHLQCHFGLDSLSLARLGAHVTGVDFSQVAIDAANELADRAELNARFLCCDVLKLSEHLNEQFDIVFTSFGVLGWLPCMRQWASVVARFLKPGGLLYLLEFDRHFIQLNEGGFIAYDYFHRNQPDKEVVTDTYADQKTHEPMDEFWWNHSMADILNGLIEAGLRIESLAEFPYSPYRLHDGMVEAGPGRWVHREIGEKIPYMFSIRATK